MNITSRLNYKNAQLKRKLYDNRVRLKGIDVKAIHLQTEEDRYGNKDFTIVQHGTLEIVLDIPSKEILMGNTNRVNNPTYQQYASVYDLLPIIGYPKNDSLLENDDIILFKYLLTPLVDENVQPESFLQVLQVASTLGRFSNTLMYKAYHLAPYNFNLGEYPEVSALLEQYQLEPVVLF